jgi:hypothetical protein
MPSLATAISLKTIRQRYESLPGDLVSRREQVNHKYSAFGMIQSVDLTAILTN